MAHGLRQLLHTLRRDVGAEARLVHALTCTPLCDLLYTKAGARPTRPAAATIGSLPALKAYLAGESHFCAGRFAPAVEAYYIPDWLLSEISETSRRGCR